jgi:hypothetical protein
MGGPERAPQAPRRSGRHGYAGAALEILRRQFQDVPLMRIRPSGTAFIPFRFLAYARM